MLLDLIKWMPVYLIRFMGTNPSKLLTDPDVLILGGGILGVVNALECAELGRSVLLIRGSDAVRPQCATLLNHGWQQSGLLYDGVRGGSGIFEAKKMLAAA